MHRFWLPVCLSISPHFLAEAAAYIACRNNDRIFSFKWCIEDTKGSVLTERTASTYCIIYGFVACVDIESTNNASYLLPSKTVEEVLKEYRALMEWKRGQRVSFETLLSTSGSAGGTGPWSAKEVFKVQQGGLRIDSSLIQVESEFTKKGMNDSKDIIVTNIGGGRNNAGRGNYDSRASYSRGPNQRGRDSDGRSAVKDENRNSRYDDRNRDNRNWSRNGKSSGGRDDRSGSSRTDNGSQRGRDRDERDRRRGKSPRRNDSQSRTRDREPDKKERESDRPRRSRSSSPRTSSSSNSKKKRKRNESGGRSDSHSPSRSHSRDRTSSYFSRSDQKGSSYFRDRNDHKTDRKPSSRPDVKPKVEQESQGK